MNTKHAAVAALAAVALAAGAFAAGKTQQPITIMKPGDMKWGPVQPGQPAGGPTVAVLWGDPQKGPVGFLLKVPNGYNSGVHAHTSDYRGVVLQGSVTATETDDPKAEGLPPGSYYFQPGQQMHHNACKTADGCLLYIEMTQGGIDFIPKDKPVAAKK